MSPIKYHKISDFEKNCLAIYLTICVFCSINPFFRSVWLVENITVWLFLILVIYVRLYHCQLSRTSILLITIACILHTIGGYYTFSHVPFGKYLFLLGELGRNNFDRLGHFFCGTLVYPLLDVSKQRKLFSNQFIMFIFAIFAMMGVAAIYELFEWLDFIIAEKQHAELFIGNKLDHWDPHADMLNCLVGSIFFSILFFLKYKNTKHSMILNK